MASAPRKTVLITGCSEGGLGFALAQAFADAGYHVYATARNPGKAASLTGSSAHVELLQLDVTSAESIAACAADVRQRTSHAGRRGLDVLVNNAGVGLIMPLLDTPIQEGRKLYEVNVWGMLAVTQAFAPLLLDAKGVVLNISSIAGAVRMAWQGSRLSLWPSPSRLPKPPQDFDTRPMSICIIKLD
jgi:NAD(P)-dependent dehydrogenase (short-subunit alcohol dehydrogenase family)